MRRSSLFLLSFVCCVSFSADARPTSFRDAFGPRYRSTAPRAHHVPATAMDMLHRWNEIAINATGLDHTPVAPGENRVFGEQVGPGRSSRAMAIVHIAIFDAMNAISGGYRGYTGVTARGAVSMDAAIAQAAHDTLVALFPSQRASFDALLAADLARIKNPAQKSGGIVLGQSAAAAILRMRVGDGSEVAEPRLGLEHFTSTLPGHWRQDPISGIPLALGGHWGECRPFVLQSPDQFRLPPPPAMTSPEYAAAYNEVKRLGGDGVVTPTERTPEQTFIGTFWAYDGTPSLCAPPRLYNQIAVRIADQTKLNALQLGRLLALVNVAMAEAGFASWDSKFHWDLWRPITGIRESDVGTGPEGLGDGNLNTIGDPGFTPLGAPASNLLGPNFTPPFPSYPSGHATFGGALFQVLRRFYGKDSVPFTFVSDEFNGTTRANDGTVRPSIPRTFSSLSHAEEENGRSRIYLGIHWAFDSTAGISQGRRVGDYVFDRLFTPTKK